MVILIILLIMSAGVIIGTYLFLKYDENRIKQLRYKRYEPVPEKLKKYNIKDLWGIDDIRDGIIYLHGNRYSTVLSISPIDYNFLSEEEQNAVEDALRQTALSFETPVQFFSTTEYVDTNSVINDIKANNEIFNTKQANYARDMIDYLESLMNEKSIYVRKSYVILSYDGFGDEAYEKLNKAADIFISNMARANIPCERIGSGEILDLLYNTLNRGNSLKPSNVVEKGGFELYVTGQSSEIPYEKGE
ncbi:MAG: hypothetical protein ACFWT2_12270 [Thermoanaerobacterium thermosaccharolyticum]|jgi:hypothetical protein